MERCRLRITGRSEVDKDDLTESLAAQFEEVDVHLPNWLA